MRPPLFLQDLKAYWVSRRFLVRLTFLSRKWLYAWREKVVAGSHAGSIVFGLIVSVWQMGIIAIAIIIALQFVEYTFHRNLSLILLSIPSWSAKLIQFLLDFVQLEKGAINQFLGTVAAVAGVFLGLYFAAISVVAGAMFVNVPGIVREQLMREKAGVLNVRALVLLTSTSILLLGYQAVGGTTGALNLFWVMGLCLFCALSFLLLGARVFKFFDYYELARPVIADLRREIRRATTKGFAWDDESFQAHYQKMASQHLDALRVFVQTVLAMKEKEEEPLVALVRSLFYLLAQYQMEKRKIPTNSRWYEFTPVYQNWFLADSSELTVAMNTNVGIQPKLQPNLYWLEEKAIQLLEVALSDLLSRRRLQATFRILQPANYVLKIYGKELAFEEAGKAISLMRTEVLNATKHLDPKTANRIQSGDYYLALIDCHGYSVLDFMMGFFEGMAANKLATIKKRLRISWESPKNLYSKDFPCGMLDRLEFVQRTTAFEKSVEGKNISPSWYRDQLIMAQYLQLLSVGMKKTIELLGSEFLEVAMGYLENGQVVFAAMQAERGLEVCDKIQYHLAVSKKEIDSFEAIRTLLELPWPVWDWEKMKHDVQSRRETLLGTLADCLPLLGMLERPADAPDVFGQAYNSVYHHTVFLLEKNRSDEFNSMYPRLFVGAISARNRLLNEKEIVSADSKSKIVFGSEPLIDILDLSGYAKIYSELYLNAKLWDICENTWNKYLDSIKDASNVVKLLIGLYQYRKSLYSLIPRDVLRTNWQLQLNRILRDENLIDDFGRRGYYDDEPPLEHWSPFIRAFCSGRHEPFVSSVEVFLLLYLLKRPEAKGIEFSDTDDLREAIEQELLRQQPRNDVKGTKQ